MKFFTSLVIIFAFLFLMLFQADNALTQDLGRHLMLGKIIVSCRCVPKTNLFSYTHPDFPFINHHWFSEVVFYELVRLGGLPLLYFIKICVIMLSFFAVFCLSYKKSSAFWAVIYSVPFIMVLAERFDTRPEIFSFLFLSLVLVLIYLYQRTKKTLYLLFIPLIELVWVNMHIYFLVGIGLLFFLMLEDVWESRKLSLKLLGIFILSILATALNPHGIAGLLYPLQVFGNYGYSIEENQNIFFLNSFFFDPHIFVFELLALISAILFAFSFKRVSVFWLLSFLFALVAGFMMVRNFPIFVFIVYPVLCQFSFQAFSRFEQKTPPEAVKLAYVVFLLVIGLCVFVSVKNHLFSPNLGYSYFDPAKNAVRFLQKQKLKGRIFNNFDIGSYLIYRLYPEYRVFVDGRPEAYPALFFTEYKKMQTDQSYFDKKSREYGINTVFFTRTDITPWAQSFLLWVREDKKWKSIYKDSYVIILARSSL